LCRVGRNKTTTRSIDLGLIRQLGFATNNLPTKYEMSVFTGYKGMKGNDKV